MARPQCPWFRAEKNAWFITLEGKMIALGVKGKDNKAEALTAWHRLMAQERPTPSQEALTVGEVLDAFLADAESRVQPITLSFYRRFLLPFKEQHGNLKTDRLTLHRAEAFARKPTWSSSTRNDCLGTLAIAFRWAERSRMVDRSPLHGIRLPPKESQGAEAVISQEDYRRLLDATDGEFNALIRFLWQVGCRPSEATALTAESVDSASGCIILRKHKTAHKGKVRVIYLNAEALAVLTAQKQRHGEGLLFRSEWGTAFSRKCLAQKFWRLSKALGVRLTAYGFRHSWATRALSQGVPDAQVAALLGHSGTIMLHKHYSHLTEQSQALREALAKVR